MGMFDTVQYNGREYQTKGLAKELDKYHIFDGKLYMTGSGCPDEDFLPGYLSKRIRERSKLTAEFQMYRYTDEPEDAFYQANVGVENGLVLYIDEQVWFNRTLLAKKREAERAERVAAGGPEYTEEEEALHKAFKDAYRNKTALFPGGYRFSDE